MYIGAKAFSRYLSAQTAIRLTKGGEDISTESRGGDKYPRPSSRSLFPQKPLRF